MVLIVREIYKGSPAQGPLLADCYLSEFSIRDHLNDRFG